MLSSSFDMGLFFFTFYCFESFCLQEAPRKIYKSVYTQCSVNEQINFFFRKISKCLHVPVKEIHLDGLVSSPYFWCC